MIQLRDIEPIVGTALLTKLERLTEEKAINLIDNKNYKTLLEDYLYPIFSWLAMSELAVMTPVKIRNAGVVQSNAEQFSQVPLNSIQYYKDYYKNNADVYITKTYKYLACKKNCFPELKECDCFDHCKTKAGKKQLNTPLNFAPVFVRPRVFR